MDGPSQSRGRRGKTRDSPEKRKGWLPPPNRCHHAEGKAKVVDEVEVVRRAGLLAHDAIATPSRDQTSWWVAYPYASGHDEHDDDGHHAAGENIMWSSSDICKNRNYLVQLISLLDKQNAYIFM
jgi:hypothetical protein